MDHRVRPIRCGRAPAAVTARCTAITATSPGSCCSPAAPPPSITACRIPRSPATANGSARASSDCRRSSRAAFPEHLATEGDIGFWPGCDAIDKGAADIAAAMALFERIGLEHVKIVEAPQACAGYPLLAAGHRDLFRWHAGRVAAAMRGFRKVAINCSACLYAVRAQYAAEGVSVRTEVVSLADLLAPAANNLACSLNRAIVYYHDPCYHARYNDVSSSRAARSRSSPRSASSRGTRPTPSAAAAVACCRRRCR